MSKVFKTDARNVAPEDFSDADRKILAELFLKYIADVRFGFVETLRNSAELLRGDSPWEIDGDPAVNARVRHKLSDSLLEVAAQLCDHARIYGNNRCRYCEAIVIQ